MKLLLNTSFIPIGLGTKQVSAIMCKSQIRTSRGREISTLSFNL